MEALVDFSTVLSALCKAKNKFGIYVSHQHGELAPEVLVKAIPFLQGDDLVQFWHRGWGYLLFDTEDLMVSSYRQIAGDDCWTTEFDPRVYACTCGPDGVCLTENT